MQTRGYDEVYGARPLRRTIQRDILNPLAIQMLEEHFGDRVGIEVDFEDWGFRFSRGVIRLYHERSGRTNSSKKRLLFSDMLIGGAFFVGVRDQLKSLFE